jgi:hypothetical protein
VTAKPADAPDVQVVIPATRAGSVVDVVRQLARHGLDRGALVVDDTRDGRVADALAGQPVRVLRSMAAGCGMARNVGAEAATATWLLFVDDDVVLPADFGAAVRRQLDLASSEVAIVGSRVVAAGEASRPFWRCRLVETPPSGGFIGACLLVRRDVYAAVGGCRRTRYQFQEDTDLWLRIVGRGHRGLLTGDLWITHPVERMSLARYLRTATCFREDGWFNRRHPGHLRGSGRALVVGPLTLRHLRRRLPLLGVAAMAPLALVARRPWAAAAGPLAAGLGLHLVHLRALRRAGYRVPAAAVLDPVEIAVHAAWGVVAVCARIVGEIDCLRAREPRSP